MNTGQVASPSVSDFHISESSTDDGEANRNCSAPIFDNALAPPSDDQSISMEAGEIRAGEICESETRENEIDCRHQDIMQQLGDSTQQREGIMQHHGAYTQHREDNMQQLGDCIQNRVDNMQQLDEHTALDRGDRMIRGEVRNDRGGGIGGGRTEWIPDNQLEERNAEDCLEEKGDKRDNDLRRRCRRNAEQRRRDMHKQESGITVLILCLYFLPSFYLYLYIILSVYLFHYLSRISFLILSIVLYYKS